jgi:hypothetical protein
MKIEATLAYLLIVKYFCHPQNGAHNWTRTNDLFLTKEVLYQLSYMGLIGAGDGNRTHAISLEG